MKPSLLIHVLPGLPYDIPYQYNLSDMDKAYMRIMYPANDPTTATEQQLQAALVTVGIVKDDPPTADKIRQLSKAADANGVVDPSQIRDLFSAWCRRAIAVTVTNPNGMPNGGAHNGLQAPKPAPTPAPPSQPILITKGPMCETEEDPGAPFPKPAPTPPGKTPSNKVKDALPGVLRAVNRVSAIDRRWKLDAVEVKPASKAFAAAATFSFAPCPVSKAKPTEFVQPSEYRMKLVQAAFLEWSKSASITFTGIAHPADNAPAIDGLKHCVIVFQDTHYGTGNHFAFNDADYRSYAQQKTSAPEAPSNASDANAMKRYEAKVPRKHTICYRGIVETAEEGAQPAPDIIQVVPGKVVTKEMHSLRTLIHEVSSRRFHHLMLQGLPTDDVVP